MFPLRHIIHPHFLPHLGQENWVPRIMWYKATAWSQLRFVERPLNLSRRNAETIDAEFCWPAGELVSLWFTQATGAYIRSGYAVYMYRAYEAGVVLATPVAVFCSAWNI